MSQPAIKAPAEPAPKKLDDVMLAMDVVDTLRHRERVLEKELSVEAREDALVTRLREIYAAQGIEVPDRILRDGVKALEEKRFVYEPPRGGLQFALARIYVRRGRWLKPLAAVLGVAAFATAAYEVGVDGPRERRERAEQIELVQTIPKNLEAARDEALKLAQTDHARRRIETAYQDGAAALRDEQATTAKGHVEELTALRDDLGKDLTVRVVSRQDEYSGVFRIPDDAPDARNYYLIVEAVDARGEPQTLEISSEEDQATKRVDRWGVRVSEGEFNRIAADKQDDRIIQNAVVGAKPRGTLTPEYRVDTRGGHILEW